MEVFGEFKQIPRMQLFKNMTQIFLIFFFFFCKILTGVFLLEFIFSDQAKATLIEGGGVVCATK